MKCPSCGNENAYVGATVVECPNVLCAHFSTRQHDEVFGKRDTVSATSVVNTTAAVPKPDLNQYVWTHYHQDFG